MGCLVSEMRKPKAMQDPVRIATRYRDQLCAELEKVEAFIRTGEEIDLDGTAWGEDLLARGLIGSPGYYH
jgi:hypothetical protein